MSSHSGRKHSRVAILPGVWALALLAALALPVAAQTSPRGPNTGAIQFTGGLDAPTVYVFRGIVQEVSPKITLRPYGDLGIAITSGDAGALKTMSVNVGVSHSLQTGSSGSDGFSGHAHYEEDFYTTMNLGLGGGVVVGAGYMARTSPNNMLDTVKELQVKVARAHRLSPYGFLALELTNKSADGGTGKGSYLELGVGPALPLGGHRATLTIPVNVGLSLKNYYELHGKDHALGFFDVGGLWTMPLGAGAGRFGTWTVHGGADVLMFGETTKAFNVGEDGKTKGSKVVAQVGIRVRY